MALTRIPGTFLDSTSNVTFAGISTTGNVTAGNIKTDNLLYANGSPWSLGGTYANSNVAAYLPTYTGQMANALIAGTVYTNAQPNITSVGTLSSLTVTGLITATAGGIKVGNLQDTTGTNTIQLTNSDILVTGNISAGAGGTGNVTATYFVGNGAYLTGLPASYANSNVGTYLPTYTGNLNPANLVVSNFTNLGDVGNINIAGGANGQLLQTDGSGNVSWVTATGTTITVDNFVGDGTETNYTLTITPASELYTLVAMAGTIQPRSVYSITGNVLTFSSAPPISAPIEITTFSSVMGFGTGDITANSFTANVLTANVLTANTLSGNIISSTSNLTVSTLTANSVVSGGSGTPTLQSNTSIVLSAATVVRVSTSPMQFYTCTSTVRDALAASDGYVIYNTTTNKLQVYSNGSWVDLH